MCGFLIQECRDSGGTRRGCRTHVRRDCREHGPAACQAAVDRGTACQRLCGDIQSQCEDALGPSMLTEASCVAFASNRCEQHGADYCRAASTTVNGCNRVAAEDHRGEAAVTVSFSADDPLLGFDYSPECVLVSPGTTIDFEGPFAEAPLVGGIAPHVDPDSPFSRPPSGGASREFVLPTPGAFPYFSTTFGDNWSLAWGAVLVDGDQ